MTEPSTKPRRRWRRWLLRGVVALLAARLLLALFLPRVIAFAAGFAGLDVTVRTASLSLSGLALHADDLVVRQTADPTAPPLLAAHGFTVDLSLAHLLVGDLVLVDSALTGAVLTVQRGKDGSLRLPAAWLAPATPATTSPASKNPIPARFEAPLSIVSLRLHDLVLQFEDTADPDRSWSARLDVEVAEFGRRDRPGVAMARVHQPAWFDNAWVRTEARLQPDRLAVTWEASVRGVRKSRLALPEPLAQWLAGARVLDATLGGTVHATTDSSGKPAEFAVVVRGNLQADESARAEVTAAVGPGPMQMSAAGWPFTFEWKAPGLVERVQVDQGQLVATDGGALRARCQASGITLAHLQPWLRTQGLAVDPAGLELSCRIAASGGATPGCTVDDFVAIGANERLTIKHAAVLGVQANAATTRIARIELDQVAATLRATADGGIGSLGVALHPAAEPIPSAAPPAATTWPNVRVDALAIRDVTAAWRDERTMPARELTATITTLSGENLASGGNGPPGSFHALLQVADAARAVRLDGTLQTGDGSLRADLQCAGDGVTLAALRPWLTPAGIEPVLRDGAFALAATADVSLHDDGVAVAGKCMNLRLRDGDDVLVSLRSLEGTGLRLGPNGVALGDWNLREPFATLRHHDGRIEIAGLAFPSAPTSDATPTPPAAAPDSPRSFLPEHGTLAVERAVLRVSDGTGPPIAIGCDARLERTDPATATTPLSATVRSEGIVQSATMVGTLQHGNGLGLAATLEANGLRGDGLSRFLPASIACTLVDGALQAKVTATLPTSSAAATELRLDDFVLRDRGTELAAVQRLHGAFACPDADHVTFRTLRLDGVRAVLARTEAGLHGPGFLLPRAASDAPAAVPPEPAATPTRLLPLVAIDDFAFELERVVLRDRTDGDGEPLVLTASGATSGPWHPTLDGDHGPLRLQGTVGIEPLLREFTFDVAVDPYATKPTLAAHLHAAGLDPSSLARVLPALGARVEGTTTNVSAVADLHATLDLFRRDGRSLPGDRPFGGEFVFDDVVLRDDDTGTELLRIGMLDVNARAIDRRTGDVLLRSVHLDGCALHGDRTAAGFEGLGVRLLPGPTPAVPATAATTATAATRPDAGARSPEFAIDRLHVSGLDLGFTDRTTTPPTVLPIVDGSLTVRGLTTAPDDHSPPIGFALHLHGGQVPLDRRIVRSSVFAGVLGAAAEAIGGAADRHEPEPRPLFDELEATGELHPRAPWRGRAQVAVTKFELAALRGLAKDSGIDIHDGVLDQTVRVELRGHDGLDLATLPVFTWLSLTEPPGGPISTYLRLPAPLDSVLFLLRDDDDEHRLPVNLHLPAAGLSPATLNEAIAEAVLRLVSAAVAGSAARAASVVTGALGLHGKGDLPAPLEFTFAPGDPAPTPTDVAALTERLRADPSLELLLVHELGAGDLARLLPLATPPAATIAAEAQRLRERKAALQQQRGPLQETTSAMFAAGRLHEAHQSQRQLAALLTDLGELELTLDAMLEMLAGDTPRAAARRNHDAAVELATSRLLTVRTHLRLVDPTLASGRIRTKPPRGVPTADRPEGGRVVASIRRRNGQ